MIAIEKEEKLWINYQVELKLLMSIDMEKLVADQIISSASNARFLSWAKGVEWKLQVAKQSLQKIKEVINECDVISDEALNTLIALGQLQDKNGIKDNVDIRSLNANFQKMVKEALDIPTPNAKNLHKLIELHLVASQAIDHLNIYEQHVETAKDTHLTWKVRMTNVAILQHKDLMHILKTFQAW